MHLALLRAQRAHSVFVVAAEEDCATVAARARAARARALLDRAELLELSIDAFEAEKAWLERHAEPFAYSGANWAGGSIVEDPAAVGLSLVARRARATGALVYLSGSGSDEIISDYGYPSYFFPPARRSTATISAESDARHNRICHLHRRLSTGSLPQPISFTPPPSPSGSHPGSRGRRSFHTARLAASFRNLWGLCSRGSHSSLAPNRTIS